ncbi:MAG TPA: SDR family oxidoreductase [Luteolibacter sp.]
MNHLILTGGGGGGLGQAVQREFSGWDVVAPSRDELDVTVPIAVRDFFKSRQVDLLVCGAGMIRDAPLAKTDESAWDEIFAVNYHGAAACAAAALPQMIAQGSGHVVFISSQSAIRPPIGQAAYAAAKAALIGLTSSLARENGPCGIRVNVILPGFLETRMTENVSARRRAQVLSDHALGRFNTPAAVAKFIRYLHEELPHTSGQTFQLDSRIL